jgi:hypothetical protein
MMSNSSMAFDPIGTVVDWIDACRQRSLAALVDLYDDAAKVDCCEGGSFRGKSGVERYWLPKLKKPVPGAFAIDALLPEAGGVSLDYRDHDGRPVRTHFRFSETGKIISTACGPTDGVFEAGGHRFAERSTRAPNQGVSAADLFPCAFARGIAHLGLLALRSAQRLHIRRNHRSDRRFWRPAHRRWADHWPVDAAIAHRLHLPVDALAGAGRFGSAAADQQQRECE